MSHHYAILDTGHPYVDFLGNLELVSEEEARAFESGDRRYAVRITIERLDVENAGEPHSPGDPLQHCTNNDCYTFSHTASFCGKPQPRKCDCGFC